MTAETNTAAQYVTVINDGSARWCATGRLLGAHHLGIGWAKIRFLDGVELPYMLAEWRDATPAEAAFAARVEKMIGFLGYPWDAASGALLDEQERMAYAEGEARDFLAGLKSKRAEQAA